MAVATKAVPIRRIGPSIIAIKTVANTNATMLEPDAITDAPSPAISPNVDGRATVIPMLIGVAIVGLLLIMATQMGWLDHGH